MAQIPNRSLGELRDMMARKSAPLKEPIELTSRICHFCELEGKFTPVSGNPIREGRYVIIMFYKGSTYVIEVKGVCYVHSTKHGNMLGKTIRR